MAHKEGGHRTPVLVFPSNWTGKWVYRAVINTPKWQLNSVLNSYKYNEWIGFESTYLNGLRLPERTDPETNYIRSVVVGIEVSRASQEYEKTFHKVPMEDKIKLLKEELETPIVGDMIRSLVQANLPMPMPSPAEMPIVELKTPQVELKEAGQKIPSIKVA